MALTSSWAGASILVVCLVSPAAAGPLGPAFPGPGNPDLDTASADPAAPGRAGGQTWTYENIDFSAFDQMWWGPWDPAETDPVKLAFDGAADEGGEILTFSAVDSDAAAGKAVWTGSAEVTHLFGTETLPTRFTLKATTLDGDPIALADAASLGIPAAVGLVAPVEGDYKVNFLFEAFRGGVWHPAADLYDALPTDPGAPEGQVVTSFSAGYWWTPVCGDGTTEGDEQCDDGSANGTLASCCDSACQLQPAATACDDGDLCTQSDTCDGAGACVGADPVVCTPLSQCHDAGTCDPGSGVCDDPAKPDGSSCDDGDGCTQTDECSAGVCNGSEPVVCTASDQCHDAGSCDPGTGACSNPEKPDGTTCDDADACTLGESCQQGSCGDGGLTLLMPLDDVGQTVECVQSLVPLP